MSKKYVLTNRGILGVSQQFVNIVNQIMLIVRIV